MTFRMRNAAFVASLGLATLLTASSGHAAWWNPFDRDRRETTRPVPAPAEPAAPVQLQTGPSTPAAAGQVPANQNPAAAPPTLAAPVPKSPVAAPPQPGMNDPGEVERLASQVRLLTGQIEELQHQLGQMREILLQVQEDSDARLRVLEGGDPALVDRRSGLHGPGQPMDGGGEDLATDAGVAGASEPVASGDAPPLLAMPAPPEPGAAPTAAPQADPDAPLDLTALSRPRLDPAADGPATVATALPAAEAPELAYDRAYNLIVAGDYGLAEQSFRQFLADHPKSALAPDAQYWLGETFLARDDYKGAADAFLVGYRQYPDSRKAPDTLLKLGLSLDALGERQAACSTFAELLKKHPDLSNALVQRVRAEQARAEC